MSLFSEFRRCAPLLIVLAGCGGHGSGVTPFVPGSESLPAYRAYPDQAPAVVEIAKLKPHPWGIASDDAGNEWIGGTSPAEFVEINESTHAKSKFAASNSNGALLGVALGRHHNGMWAVDHHANTLDYINFSTHIIHYYHVPTSNAGVWNIAAGADNAMWFTEGFVAKIGRIELAHFTISEYAVPNQGDPYDVTLGSDGNMWFTEFAANAIGRITTAGAITIFPLSHAKSAPRGITNGPDGALWFVEQNNHYPLDGRRTKGPVPNYNYYGRIGRINPQTHQISEWTLPTPNTYPEGIVGRGNKLWFAETSGYVGEIDATSHMIHEYSVPVLASGPREIALGSDDQLWFTQADGKRIGKVCPNRTDQQCSNGDL